MTRRRGGLRGSTGGPDGPMQRDSDGDGKLSMDEVPPQMERRFDQLDTNGDGFLERDELSSLRSRGRGPGGRGGGN